MTLSGIELRYLIDSIKERTQNYYVSNIYGITRDSILFKLHHPEKPDILLMFSTFGLWITTNKIDQIETNRLLKRLRSDLLRLRLTKIEQIGAERITYLTFSGFRKEFVIVGEFFGDGNIILCNKDMKILALLHSIDVRHRKLSVGLQYTPPPQNGLNIFDITQENLNEIRTSNTLAAKWLGRTLGLPRKYVEEIFRIANIDSKIPGNELSEKDSVMIFQSTKELVSKIIEGKHEAVIVRDKNNSEVYPLKIGEKTEKQTDVSSFIEGLDILFTENIVNKGKSTQTSKTDKKILELQTKIDEQTKAISLVKEKSDIISSVAKSIFEMVSQGVISIDDSRITDVLSKQNSQIIKEKGITFMKIHDDKIKINPESSLPAIASTLFDEAKRQSGAINSIEKLKKNTEKELTKLLDKAEIEKESITFSEVRKKNWYERYRWFFTSDGLLAIGGRDASSNSAVIRKHLEKNDRVFHADIFGSPFFILKNSLNPSSISLKETAHATVCFSRAWREGMYGLSAYWVNPEQVKKAAPSGQFLAKGSFTIDGQRNFLKIPNLKLAVGLLKQEDNYLLTCGPPEPIKKRCVCYVIIEPSGSEMVSIAKKIKSEFIKMQDISKSFSLDDFVRVLPAGTSHVIDSGLGDLAE